MKTLPAGSARLDTKGRVKGSRGDARTLMYARRPRCRCKLDVIVSVRTMSEGNAREHHMSRYRRKESQQLAVFNVLANCDRRALPVVVTLTRLSARKVDPGAEWMKHVQDEVARWLGCDDGDESSVEWIYRQQKSTGFEVRIEVECVAQAATGNTRDSLKDSTAVKCGNVE